MSEQKHSRSVGSGWSRTASALLVLAGPALAGCAADAPTSGPRNNGTGTHLGAVGGQTAHGTAGAGGSTPFSTDNPTGRPMEADMPLNPMFDPNCASTNVRANRILPTVMLVVDGSTSMEMPYGDPPPPPDGGVPMGGMGGMAPAAPSRWMAVRGALVDPVNGVVPKLQSLVSFGLAVFGTAPSCPLPLGIIEPVLNNAAAITAGLPNGMSPGIFTPTGPALDMVVDHLPDSSNVAPDEPPIAPQIIVLATDGDPNACDANPFMPVTDYAPSIAAAMKAQAKHIKMYVIGVGMDAAAQHLQEMANIGQGLPQTMNPGAEVYYPENAAALSDTLAMLIGAELSCDLQLDGKGIRKDLACMGTVTLDNALLGCDDPNGWTLIDETHMRLQGTACDTYKAAADSHLIADFPCEVIIPG